MAIQPTPLVEPLQLLAGAHAYYTAPNTTRIDKMTVSNVDIVPRHVILYWVPQGGSLSDPATVLIPSFPLQPGEARDLWQYMGHVLATGDQIGASCDSGGAVNFFASGTQVTTS